MNQGSLIVLSGFSGAGKSTVINQVLSQRPEIYFSISFTTRQPRAGEVNGVNYNFVTREEFEARIERGEFLEYAQYNGNYYGTPLDPVEEHLEQGHDVILEIELQGALQVKKRLPQAVTVFIAPPSFEELERRLRGRGTETEEVIQKRLAIARQECASMDEFRFIVVNDEVDAAADRLRAIMLSCRCLRENLNFTLN